MISWCVETSSISGGRLFSRTGRNRSGHHRDPVGREGGAQVQTVAAGRGAEHAPNMRRYSRLNCEGLSERVLGQSLRNLGVAREEVVVATKVLGRMGPGPNGAGMSRGHIMDQVRASLERLRLDHIDLYQIHGFDLATPTISARSRSSCPARTWWRSMPSAACGLDGQYWPAIFRRCCASRFSSPWKLAVVAARKASRSRRPWIWMLR